MLVDLESVLPCLNNFFCRFGDDLMCGGVRIVGDLMSGVVFPFKLSIFFGRFRDIGRLGDAVQGLVVGVAVGERPRLHPAQAEVEDACVRHPAGEAGLLDGGLDVAHRLQLRVHPAALHGRVRPLDLVALVVRPRQRHTGQHVERQLPVGLGVPDRFALRGRLQGLGRLGGVVCLSPPLLRVFLTLTFLRSLWCFSSAGLLSSWSAVTGTGRTVLGPREQVG